jgi:hypothetical protein
MPANAFIGSPKPPTHDALPRRWAAARQAGPRQCPPSLHRRTQTNSHSPEAWAERGHFYFAAARNPGGIPGEFRGFAAGARKCYS